MENVVKDWLDETDRRLLAESIPRAMKPPDDRSFDRRYPERPFIGVGVVVWRDDKVLLIKRGKSPRKGQWSIPGGLQQSGETVAEAARREVREETSVEIEIVDQIAVIDSIQRDDGGRVLYHYTLVDFVAHWVSGEAKAQDDAADAAWVALDELDRYTLWHETLRVIALAKERRRPQSLLR